MSRRPGLNSWPEREALLVTLIALHSYAVGLFLMFGSSLALRLGQWEAGGTLFFTRQGGVFHLLIATIYLIDYFRRGSILPVVLAKAIAVAFLFWMAAIGEPWLVAVSGVVDGLMLVSVLWARARSNAHVDADHP